MNTEQIDTETSLFSIIISPALSGLMICSYILNDYSITFLTYRQTASELAMYLKLSSLFRANSPIDCHVIDKIEDKFRFTIIYNIQSLNNNTRMQVITKTNDILPIISLQEIYPAFN